MVGLMEYTIAVGASRQRLIDRVSELITKGWQPQGGISSTIEKGYSSYYQAMTKHKVSLREIVI